MKKNGFLDSIRVASECSEDWEEMSGNETVRFCRHCAFEVNNLSALKRKQALRLVRESEGRICVRYVKHPETNAPVFAEKLYQITRRAGIAAGVLGASLTLSTLAYAQGEAVNLSVKAPVETSGENQSDRDKTESPTGAISGTATDPNGAVVPNVAVKLSNGKTGESRTATTDENGFYEFKNLSPETYKIVTEATAGFAAYEVQEVQVSENANVKVDLSMTLRPISFTMGMVALSYVEYQQPLLKAISNENFEEVKDLIAKGADVNAKDKNYGESTALHVAVENGNREIAKYLLDMGAKINARDRQRRTPLMSIDDDAKPELVRMLLDHRAKVNAFDAEENTALIFAAQCENAEILRVLIDAGARINAQNKEGETALMLAAENDYYANVEALLEAGADVHLRDKEGNTALDLTDDEKIRNLLKSRNAKE
ncbi:MAG TPA: ankyrin repeat domain-containing protein [Pyrinomonadaceae bacterium]|jgi:hypothetical protein